MSKSERSKRQWSKSAYLPGDPIPLPEVLDQDSEACWSLWNEAVQAQDAPPEQKRHWAPTEPAKLSEGMPPITPDPKRR